MNPALKRHQLRRTLSEPPNGRPSSMCTMISSSLSRERNRSTQMSYERGKDCVTVWLNSWNTKEICIVLTGLVQRCTLNQMKFLWTALESVPHRDFLYQAARKFPMIQFQPLSTPVSRDVKSRLSRSKRPENKTLYRTQSVIIKHPDSHHSKPSTTVIPQATPIIKLPGVRPATAPDNYTENQSSNDFSLRICSPARRHMHITLSHLGTTSCYTEVRTDAWTTTKKRTVHMSSLHDSNTSVPHNGIRLLSWFSSLYKDWQQQDILQLVVWSLNQKELYYLAVLLMTRQYRDFIQDLPESLALKILSYVPGKDILLGCQVSKHWYSHCANDRLWRIKCSQTQLGLPPIINPTWRQLFIDDIKLKRNWRLGQATVLSLTSHTHRVLCVNVKEKDEICASGSMDRTIKLWRLTDGKLLNTLYGHTKGIWCLFFYGHNLLISGSSDSSIKIWNIRTSRCERSLECHTGTVWSMKQTGDILVTGSHDNTAILWNIRQCRYLRHLRGHTGAVFAVDLNDNSKLAFTASGDKTIRIWNVDEGQCTQVIQASTKYPIMTLNVSKSLLACSAGNVVSLWSISRGTKIHDFKGHEDRVESIDLQTQGSNSNTIISCSRDGLIKYWNINSGRCIRTLKGHSNTINDIHRDGIRIVSASDDKTLKITDFHPHSKLKIISSTDVYNDVSNSITLVRNVK